MVSLISIYKEFLMQKILSRGFITVLASSILFVSCSSTTRITSIPEGAKVYMDGEYKGVTPYTHSDNKVFFNETQMQLKKEGYREMNVVLKKDKFSVGPCIGGVFFLIPFLWVMDYTPSKQYELEQNEIKK
jgi:hypothetical protein